MTVEMDGPCKNMTLRGGCTPGKAVQITRYMPTLMPSLKVGIREGILMPTVGIRVGAALGGSWAALGRLLGGSGRFGLLWAALGRLLAALGGSLADRS